MEFYGTYHSLVRLTHLSRAVCAPHPHRPHCIHLHEISITHELPRTKYDIKIIFFSRLTLHNFFPVLLQCRPASVNAMRTGQNNELLMVEMEPTKKKKWNYETNKRTKERTSHNRNWKYSHIQFVQNCRCTTTNMTTTSWENLVQLH